MVQRTQNFNLPYIEPTDTPVTYPATNQELVTSLDKLMPGPQGPPGNMSEIWSATPPLGAPGVRWIKPASLLKTAFAHWDASKVGASNDRLLDQTTGGRDLIFGAAAAAPVIVPYSGQPYVRQPGIAGNYVELPGPTGTGVTSAVIVQRMSNWIGGQGSGIASIGAVNNTSLSWGIASDAANHITSHKSTGTAVEVLASTTTIDLVGFPYNRFTFNAGNVTWERSADGTAWSQAWTATHTHTAISYTGLRAGSVNGVAFGFPYSLYSATFTIGGVKVAEMLPANKSADYSAIANTGTLGGTWNIVRTTTSFQTAIVDRPLILFGGAQSMTTAALNVAGPRACTLVAAIRRHTASTSFEQWLRAGHDGGTDKQYVLAGGGGSGLLLAAQVVDGSAYSNYDGSINMSGGAGQNVPGIAFDDVSAYCHPGRTTDSTINRTSLRGAWAAGDMITAGGNQARNEWLAAAIISRKLTATEVDWLVAELLGYSGSGYWGTAPTEYVWNQQTGQWVTLA